MLETICGIITAVATIFIALQLFSMLRTEKKNREETRRIKTIEIMQHWSESLKKETSYAEKIVEGFSEDQCRSLYLREPFEVDRKRARMICQICPEFREECTKFQGGCTRFQEDCTQCQPDGKYVVDGMLLSELRWYVIMYLNMLETVMTAWNLKIVDEEEILHQFQYLYNSQMGWDALESFRKAAGGEDAYPNIERFIDKLKEKGKTESNKKKAL